MNIDSQVPMIDGEQIDFNKKAPHSRGQSALFLSGYRRGFDAARGRCPSRLSHLSTRLLLSHDAVVAAAQFESEPRSIGFGE
jgi:hypothetical protein